MLTTIEEQREALGAPIDSKFVKQDRNVKGPYSTGDYVVWKLNEIFGPDNWKHTIQQGPELITNSDQAAYAQVTIRLMVQFANGEQVTHDDVGIWPFKATRGQTLEGTAPERYETVIKASITDGIKACVEYLGICFRPMADENLYRHITGQQKVAGRKKAPTNGGEIKEETEPEPQPEPVGNNGETDKYFDIRPTGPKDYTTFYGKSVPAFVDEDGKELDRIQAADILKTAKENAVEAFVTLTKRFELKEA